MSDELTHATFAPRVHDVFRVQVDDRAVEVTLTEISALRTSPRSEAFSLVFTGPASQPLPQAEYRFHHPAMGTFNLFIVPIGGDADTWRYEATFNRLRTT